MRDSFSSTTLHIAFMRGSALGRSDDAFFERDTISLLTAIASRQANVKQPDSTARLSSKVGTRGGTCGVRLSVQSGGWGVLWADCLHELLCVAAGPVCTHS